MLYIVRIWFCVCSSICFGFVFCFGSVLVSDFRCGGLKFIVILVTYEYKSR